MKNIYKPLRTHKIKLVGHRYPNKKWVDWYSPRFKTYVNPDAYKR